MVVPCRLRLLVFQIFISIFDGIHRHQADWGDQRVIQLHQQGFFAEGADAVVGEERQVFGVGRADDGLHRHESEECLHAQVRDRGAAVPVVRLQMKFHPPAGECLPRAYILGNELAPRGKQIDHGIVHLYAVFCFQIKITRFPADYCPPIGCAGNIYCLSAQ